MQGTVTDDGIVARQPSLRSSKNTGTKERSQHGSQAAPDAIESINKALAEKVGQQKYRIWFKNSTKLTLKDGYLKVSVPNPFIANWIENHFLNEIREAAARPPGR
jgi:chromosomal replication initiator protein